MEKINGSSNTIITSTDGCNFNDIPGSFKFIYDKLSDLAVSFNTRLDDIVGLLDSLKFENSTLKATILQLESKIDKMEQLSLNNSADIIGLPVLRDNNEILKTTLQLFNTGLNLTVKESDIISVYQLKSTDNKPGKVVVRFNNNSIRNTVVQAKRKIKQLTTGCLNMRDVNLIFINECMTKFKYNLFKKCKEIKKSKNYKYLWSRNGRIMLRKYEGDVVRIIDSSGDLDAL